MQKLHAVTGEGSLRVLPMLSLLSLPLAPLGAVSIVAANTPPQPAGKATGAPFTLQADMAKSPQTPSPAAPMAVASSRSDDLKFETIQHRQSGYWRRLSRRATVRNQPGGDVLHTLEPGQLFHIYDEYRHPSWLLGYACPDGGADCGSGQAIVGFVLRDAFENRGAAAPAQGPARFAVANNVSEVKIQTADWSPTGSVHLQRIAHEQRRVIARELYLRNDLLHPIGLLRAGDVFIVGRYTDGSQNDGQRRWAIGWAKGAGVDPNNNYGRVLVEGLG